MILDFLALSFNNLKRRKLRSWLTMIGIFIGIAAVVSLISLGQGLQTAITAQFGSLDLDVLFVQNAETGFGPPGSTAITKLNDHDLDIVKTVRGIKKVRYQLIRVAEVKYNKQSGFYYLTNLEEDSEELRNAEERINVKLAEGRYLKVGDNRKIMIGSGIAEKSTFGKEIILGTRLIIQGEEFEVIGIFERGSTALMNSVVYMFTDDLKQILDIGDEMDIITVQVQNTNDIEQIAKDIEKALRKDRGLDIGEEDFSVETPTQSLESVNTILSVVNLVVAGIAAISLIVGGIGIMNTMYTSVLERTKEIGTMKAIGAKNSDILKIFLFESGLLGLTGGLIGAVLGAGFAFLVAVGANTAFGSQLIDVNLSFNLILGAISFSFFVGLFSGLFPAMQASKLKPVEALRG